MQPRRLVAVTVALLSGACTTRQSRPAPDPGSVVRADNREFLVFACRGAQSAGLRCPAQKPTATYLRGGLVCQASANNAPTAPVESLPPSVCEGLFGGCVAATPPPARGQPYALTEGETARIHAAGFHFVACGESGFRLDSNEPPPPAQTEPPPPPPPVDADAGAQADPNALQAPPVQPTTPAAPVERTEDTELESRTEQVRVALVLERVARSTGVGLCHTAPNEALPRGAFCVRIELDSDGARPDVIAERFRQIAASSGHPLRLSFSIIEPVRSRCAANDLDCAPIVSGNVCPEAVGFRHGAARSALSSAVNVGVDLRRYESGRCRNDGDCYVGGCGQHCVSTATRSFASTCEGIDGIDTAACGCVRGRCRWFLPASN